MELSAWRMWWHRIGERELREVAMENWDPIGVAGFPEAADEYDAYLGQIVKRLRDALSTQELGQFLTSLTAYMGLEPRPDADLTAAREMQAWYVASTARFTDHNR